MGRSTQFYRKSEEGRKKRLRYQKKYNKRPEELERRRELGRVRYAMKKNGADVDGKDVSHTKDGYKLKPKSVNRGSKTDRPGDRRARGKKRSKK